MDIGLRNAAGKGITHPLPLSWLGRLDSPAVLPDWAQFGELSATQLYNLQSQIGYTESLWDYAKVGTDDQLGRYQFTSTILESYGLITAGSNAEYGTDCVNYQHCWRPTVVRSTVLTYLNYNYNLTDLSSLLNGTVAQDHLAYQIMYDLHRDLVRSTAIQDTDTDDVVAGMIYVGWKLGAGSTPSHSSPLGTGAYAWRYNGVGDATGNYNAGRYAITVLSQ